MKPLMIICLSTLLLLTAGYCHAQGHDFFVQIELSNSSISTTDSITATVKLYTPQRIHGFGKTTFPAFKEFTVRAIESESKPMVKERYKGKTYFTGVLQQYVLHPKLSGQLTIESGSYAIIVRQKKQQSKRANDFFDTPQYTADTVHLTSPEVRLTVSPSPGNALIDPANVNAVESQRDPVEKTVNKPNVENKSAVENKNSEWISVSDENRGFLFYTSVALLTLLLIIYFSKLGSPRDAQYDYREHENVLQKKRSLVWHLPYIAGIMVLVGLIVVLYSKF